MEALNQLLKRKRISSLKGVDLDEIANSLHLRCELVCVQRYDFSLPFRVFHLYTRALLLDSRASRRAYQIKNHVSKWSQR